MNLAEILQKAYAGNLQNLVLHRVDIVSPYISEGFFTQLLEFNPNEVFLVVDAGCSERDIKNAKGLLGDRLVNNTIRLGKSSGLVHSKLYLFHFRDRQPLRPPRNLQLLVWGSCNATDGGFGRNAEIISWSKLSQIENSLEIIYYFQELYEMENAVERVLNISNGVYIVLPEIQLKNYGEMAEIDTFDLWLQKGKLCHTYPPDTYFKSIKITLKQPLQQIADNVNNTFKTNGFDIAEQTTTISYNYLRDERFIDVQEEKPRKFRALYFIETVYGKWTSQSCYDELGGTFYLKNRELRKQHVEKISSATQIDRTRWENSFINRLREIVTNIGNPELYFQMSGNDIDETSYRDKAKEQMIKDLIKTRNTWFKEFYIDGLEFIDLPPLLEFKTNWDEFALSFCSALAFEINEKETINRIAIILRDNFDCYKNKYDEDLYELLKNDWGQIKDVITRFYFRFVPNTNSWSPLIEFSRNLNLRRKLWQS